MLVALPSSSRVNQKSLQTFVLWGRGGIIPSLNTTLVDSPCSREKNFGEVDRTDRSYAFPKQTAWGGELPPVRWRMVLERNIGVSELSHPGGVDAGGIHGPQFRTQLVNGPVGLRHAGHTMH